MRKPTLMLALAIATTSAMAADRPRGVVELFTSQGCSSCPPADRIVGELARDPSLVVLSLPVDYWDYIGWKDTFASPACTARQKGYAAARGDGQVYTPQAVIDGATHVVGSDRKALESAIAARANALKVDVGARNAGGRVSVDVGAGSGKAVVWLAEILPRATVEVGRGENAGKTLDYTNVVRRMTRLGEWSGAAAHFDAPTGGADVRYIALVQEGSPERPGAIIGAAHAN